MGDVAEVPYPEEFFPENIRTPQERMRWLNGLDAEQRTRMNIAAMIHVFAHDHSLGRGGPVTENDEELIQLLRKHEI